MCSFFVKPATKRMWREFVAHMVMMMKTMGKKIILPWKDMRLVSLYSRCPASPPPLCCFQ